MQLYMQHILNVINGNLRSGELKKLKYATEMANLSTYQNWILLENNHEKKTKKEAINTILIHPNTPKNHIFIISSFSL